jgi:hypothetical protein
MCTKQLPCDNMTWQAHIDWQLRCILRLVISKGYTCALDCGPRERVREGDEIVRQGDRRVLFGETCGDQGVKYACP